MSVDGEASIRWENQMKRIVTIDCGSEILSPPGASWRLSRRGDPRLGRTRSSCCRLSEVGLMKRSRTLSVLGGSGVDEVQLSQPPRPRHQ